MPYQSLFASWLLYSETSSSCFRFTWSILVSFRVKVSKFSSLSSMSLSPVMRISLCLNVVLNILSLIDIYHLKIFHFHDTLSEGNHFSLFESDPRGLRCSEKNERTRVRWARCPGQPVQEGRVLSGVKCRVSTFDGAPPKMVYKMPLLASP